MSEISPGLAVTLFTIAAGCIGIVIATAVLAIVEGVAVVKALEGMTRQPDAAGDLRTTLIIGMALLETSAIYVLLVVLILIFANPLLQLVQ
ncbi:MAG: ATP synthase F0 subunit C [Chloroflexi bacterium]|nr:ATP synthase F0 subunit C [Chloroflexota bacterium]MBU1746055.1 ATP synthase F0 subunit C [Chloroflexota bacterium]